VPHSTVMAPAIMPEYEHMMDYHVVIHGTCWAAVAGEASVQLQIAPNVRVDISRAAIVGYQGQAPVVDAPNS